MSRYDHATALVIVDVQNDFADPAGGLSVHGGDEIVDLLNHEIAAVRDTGGLVAYTQDWHPEHTPHFAQDGGIWPVHCVAETWGAALHPKLGVHGPVIRKGTNGEDGYSGFTMRDAVSGDTASTDLERILRERAIQKVVVGGLATDYCVKATAIDAVRLGFETHLLLDSIRAVDLKDGDGERAIDEMRSNGVVVDTGPAVIAIDPDPGAGADEPTPAGELPGGTGDAGPDAAT